MSGRLILPGTPIFGVMFADGSCGCWTANRETTRRMAAECRQIGLEVRAYLTARMKRHELVEHQP